MQSEEAKNHIAGVIGNIFKGDANAYREAVTESFREIISWDDIKAVSEIFPELEETGRSIIKRLLGYMPPDYVVFPFEPSLRAVANSYRGGGITGDQFISQSEEIIKLIRNKGMEEHADIPYKDWVCEQYDNYLPHLAEQARKRLVGFLRYEPKLETSMGAEILLRMNFANDKSYLPEKLVNTDVQVITIVKYREVLLSQGKEAADKSPLMALYLAGEFLNFPDNDS